MEGGGSSPNICDFYTHGTKGYWKKVGGLHAVISCCWNAKWTKKVRFYFPNGVSSTIKLYIRFKTFSIRFATVQLQHFWADPERRRLHRRGGGSLWRRHGATQQQRHRTGTTPKVDDSRLFDRFSALLSRRLWRDGGGPGGNQHQRMETILW